MKFRTEISPAPFERKIDHMRCGVAIGSCFAESVAVRLRKAKFPLAEHRFGTLYNPFSIADALTSDEGAALLAGVDYVLITFGTAWVYELDGRVVANCGKRPAHLFTRRRLSVAEIVERFEELMNGALARKQVIFTVSPIRHLKDGFEENSLSKAILRLAIAEIVGAHPSAHSVTHPETRSATPAGSASYFPAFEILNDDLRDYRFYAADLAHPSEQAVDYIWEKFSQAAFDTQTLTLLPQIAETVRATEHRPFDPRTEEHVAFRSAMLARTRELATKHPELDLSAEMDFFAQN